MQNQERVYQFKIILEDVKPSVWRRILVPEEYSFWDLHVAIQDAMGWTDSHLHQFSTISIRPVEVKYIGIPDKNWGRELFTGWEEKIKDWFSLERRTKMNYEYDFGDGWTHKVELEKIMPAKEGEKYPKCIGGKRACPPEDCGGSWGYEDLLKIIKDPKHDQHEEMMEWIGGEFNPEDFDPEEVEFDNPKERLDDLLKHI